MRASKLDGILAALADPTRRRVIEQLRRRPRRASELARAFGMKRPAMSRHLKVLRTRGLIEEERVEHDARVRVFRLRRQPFAALSAWLDQVEAFWTAQLGSFKEHAEGRGQARESG